MSNSSIRGRSSAKKNSDSSVTEITTASSSTTTAHMIRQDVREGSASQGIFTIRPSKATGYGSTTTEAPGSTPSATPSVIPHESSPKDHDHHLGPICSWDELPAWLQDNPAILTGYRRPTFSYRKCAASLGFLHNESLNIWSHLLGALACIIGAPIAYFRLVGVLDTIGWADIVVFYIFLAGAITCLSLSASFHLFSCHSEPVAHQWNRCDYMGIAFLIAGSFYPAVFYGFYCFRNLQILYLSMITLFGLATVIAVIRPEFRTPQYRWIRSCMFLAMGLSSIFPVIHSLFIYGFNLAVKAIALDYMLLMGGSYVVGALLYGSRTPERFFPGKFDHFGASHQLFHFLVLVGVFAHFVGVTKAMVFWHDANHSCAIPISEMKVAF